MSLTVALSLLHFIWQGALIGAVAWIAMKIARTPQMRYLIGIAALALMGAAPIMTATVGPGPLSLGSGPQSSDRDTATSTSTSTAAAAGDLAVRALLPVVGADLQVRATPSSRRVADVFAAIGERLRPSALSPSFTRNVLAGWLFGVAFLSLRLLFGWLTARRLTRVGVTEPRLEILSHAERIMGALKIQHAVTVLESALVKVPMTMGWWKPVVLLPAAAMTGLSMEQIDALVAHELAHVRRHDYLVNLAQSAIETLLFYHPMVWLISRAVRHERELCCDDLAIAVCGGDTVTYASALADLESMRVAAPALAANGGSLLLRVKRILGHDAAAVSRSRTNWSAGVAIISLALVLLPINAARPKATPLPPGWEEVKADTNLGDGIAPLLNKNGAPGVVGVSPASTATTAQRGGIAGIDPLPPAIDFKRLMADRPTMVVGVEPQAPAAGGVSNPTSAKDAYDAAWGAYAAGKYTEAVAGWEGFLRNYPNSSQAFQAQYYIGQSFYSQGRYSEAAAAYAAMIANYPASAWLPDAHYKLGKSYFALGKIAEARAEMQVVVRDHRDSTYAPLAQAALQTMPTGTGGATQTAASQPSITPGQLLRLEVTVGVVRQTEFSKDFTVQPDGFIVLPYVGRTKVAGMSVDAAQEAVRALLAEKGTLPGAKVVASLEGRSSDASIFVLGEVNAPNAYPWREGLTVAQAISLAGGAKTAGLPVELLLSGGAVDRIGDLSRRVPVGASVNVLAFRNIVMRVQGAVVRPGNITLREDHVTLPDVLTAAGGLTPSAGTTIRLKRAAPGSPAAGVEVENGWELYSVVQLRNGLLTGVVLSGSDIVDVPVAPKYYVQGFVNSPGEIQWEPNLTLQRAIFKAGGATKDGAMQRVNVKRLDPQTKKYQELDLGKDPMAFIVQPNDVVEVPKKRL